MGEALVTNCQRRAASNIGSVIGERHTRPVGAEIFGVAVDDADGSLWVFAGGPTGD